MCPVTVRDEGVLLQELGDLLVRVQPDSLREYNGPVVDAASMYHVLLHGPPAAHSFLLRSFQQHRALLCANTESSYGTQAGATGTERGGAD